MGENDEGIGAGLRTMPPPRARPKAIRAFWKGVAALVKHASWRLYSYVLRAFQSAAEECCGRMTRPASRSLGLSHSALPPEKISQP